jgi:ATP-dependent 26S proteasome regulatory subunit
MLFDKIKLNYPNLWIKDTDFSRTVDIVTSTIDREYFVIDFTLGFSQLIEGTWKGVLVPNPTVEITGGPPFITTHDPSVALAWLLDNYGKFEKNSTFFINVFGDATGTIMQMAPFVTHFKSQYRKAFWNDDLSMMPLQLAFISASDCPEEFGNYFNVIQDLYPSAAEIASIVQHINTAAHDRLIEDNDIKDLVNAGLGLTESEFIDLCLTSVVNTQKLDAKFVYEAKMAGVKRNGILEIIKPTMSFDKIGGLDNIKDIIRRTAALRNNAHQAQAYGITPIRRLLMVGIPGTGKSAICQATAHELGLDLARTGISQVMNSFIGQSEANMRAVFKQIKAMNPLCVWIDEFGRDLSGGSSSSHVDGGTTDRVHGEFLTGLQELPEETFLMCAANQLEALRPEMLRADRFDKIFFVGLPSHEERKTIFQIHLSKIDTDHTYDYDALAEAAVYMTGAEIVSLIKEVKFYVVSEDFRPINTADILHHIPKIKNTIWIKHHGMVISMYEYALAQWDWASSAQMEDANIILGKTTSRKNSKVVWQ